MQAHSTTDYSRGLRKASIASALGGVLLSLSAMSALAQTSWQLITEYPQSNISGVGLTSFARNVAERTKGAVTVKAAYDNELKIPSRAMFGAAQEQRIAGGDAFAGPLEANDPIFGLASLPFVIQSVETARAVNARARPLYQAALEARGLKLLYLTIWPSTGLWSDRPLKSADDLASLNLRTYDDNSAQVMRTAGAQATFMPMSEALGKLKERQLNGVLTSGDGGAGQKLWDYLPHFTPINYAIPVSIAFVRTDLFKALPAEVQDQVTAAAADTEKSQLELLANRTTENYARMRANGVTIADQAPPDILAALRKGAAAPIAAWKGKVSPDAVAIVDWAGQQ